MSDIAWIIVAGAVVTYLTRVGGHLILSRFGKLHPRIEVALDAVPAAVLTTLVAPAAASATPAELGALIVAGLVAMRFDLLPMFLSGAVALYAFRAIGL